MDFVPASSMIDVTKPITKVIVSKDFVPGPSAIGVTKSIVKVTVSRDFVSAPKKFEVLCKELYIYVPYTPSFDFREDWTNSTVCKVFARSGIII